MKNANIRIFAGKYNGGDEIVMNDFGTARR